MGVTSSKAEASEALRLCKERNKYIKQAIDLRYNLAAAHVSYVQSLRNIGVSLRRFAECEVLMEPSLTLTPSHSAFPSPAPSHLAGISDSPLPNNSPVTPVSRYSYMKSGSSSAVAVSLDLSRTENAAFVDDVETLAFTMPPPPPPPPGSGSSWDFFDPSDEHESFQFVGHYGFHVNFGDRSVHRNVSEGENDLNGRKGESDWEIDPENQENEVFGKQVNASDVRVSENGQNGNGVAVMLTGNSASKQPSSKIDKSLAEEEMSGVRVDASDFITHRAKDFLSSIKEIEQRFFRASESGKEVSRMLEANKIRVGYSELKDGSPFWCTFGLNCCKGKPVFVSNGSHSSTLDRLYAWERKLYDEVKASEGIRKLYDRKCNQLQRQFANDSSTQALDKTRAVVKDLHSRIKVALQTVDAISKRIEKMRDEELQPQLLELIQGMIRMWKAMLECHHAQYITISLAYHAKTPTGAPPEDSKHQIITQLQHDTECFGLSFANVVNSLTTYVEVLNGWLQLCILQPRERSKGRRAFSPRRVLAPPIFVLCRDWSGNLQSLPSEELSDAIKAFLWDLQHSVEGNAGEELQRKETLGLTENGEANERGEGKSVNGLLKLSSMQASLTKVLDRLTKFSEESLKMYEDILQKSETARNAYSNYRQPPRSFSV